MGRAINDFNELKQYWDYHVIKKIVQSNLSYQEKVKELESYATPYDFKRIMKHFKRISVDL